MSLVAQGVVDLAQVVRLGHSVYNLIAVPSEKSQCLLVLSLGDVGADGEQNDLASFMGSHA